MSGFSKAKNYVISALLIAVIVVSTLLVQTFYLNGTREKADPDAYVGIAFAGNTANQAKMLIDKTDSYTNLFILATGRSDLSRNKTAVYQICDYAVSKGLSLIIDLGINDFLNVSSNTWLWQQPLSETKQNWTQRWGEKFLGIYYNDEVGGLQLDGNWTHWFLSPHHRYTSTVANNTMSLAIKELDDIYVKMFNVMGNNSTPENYDLEAKYYADILEADPGLQELKNQSIPVLMSEYGLYWWDYKAGYNVLLTELGWGDNEAEQIALVKGAARLQNKEWGAMITWKTYQAPYLDTGDEIYNQMLTAYEAGAKYVAVFDYPFNDTQNPYGVLTDDHFLALRHFWNDITQKQLPDLSQPQAALVLPSNYGWGMRNPNDKIWGFWGTDDKSQQIATVAGQLLSEYGAVLDIVYEDVAYPVSSVAYQHVYYWNQTLT
jgi:hypothetical protein